MYLVVVKVSYIIIYLRCEFCHVCICIRSIRLTKNKLDIFIEDAIQLDSLLYRIHTTILYFVCCQNLEPLTDLLHLIVGKYIYTDKGTILFILGLLILTLA